LITSVTTHREDPQQQQRRGAAQPAHLAHEGDQADGQRAGEKDGHPRRTPTRQHPAQRARQHPLLGHPVQQPAGHQHVDQAEFATANMLIGGKIWSIGRFGAPAVTTFGPTSVSQCGVRHNARLVQATVCICLQLQAH
jgi:hypothetical protein